jgi:hypothetical protein
MTMTVWRQEALAMHDCSVMAHRVALSLPERSATRQVFLRQARRYKVAARIRGVQVVRLLVPGAGRVSAGQAPSVK